MPSARAVPRHSCGSAHRCVHHARGPVRSSPSVIHTLGMPCPHAPSGSLTLAGPDPCARSDRRPACTRVGACLQDSWALFRARPYTLETGLGCGLCQETHMGHSCLGCLHPHRLSAHATTRCAHRPHVPSNDRQASFRMTNKGVASRQRACPRRRSRRACCGRVIQVASRCSSSERRPCPCVS